MSRVVVTGLAYATSLGFNHDDHEPALREGRSGAAPIRRFASAGFKNSTGGECDERRLDALLETRWPARRLRGLHVDTRLILWAVAGALDDARLAPKSPLPAGLGTTLEGFWQGEQWYEQHTRATHARVPPRRLLNVGAGGQLASIAELLELTFDPSFISNACATGVSAIGRLFRRIRRGACETGIAGGYDCLSRFIHLGFDSLGALSPRACSPFDKDRSGFFLGDGAGVLVLESLDSARRRGATIHGEIIGYGESVDAYHQTHPEPQGLGIARAIAQCLESAEIRPEEVDYINAHGTATPANDAAEARGIVAALGEVAGRKVPVSSTKALVGHTLGAAGAVEECFCLLALERGFLPPQANLTEQDPACPVNLVRRPEGSPRIAMNNSLGFGGANGVLLTRRWDGEDA